MKSTIMVGTSDGLHRIGPEPEVFLKTHTVTWIAQVGARWWAILDGRELWCSENQDAWAQITSIGSLRANCVLPYGGGVLVGASDSHLHRLSDNVLEPVESFDEAPGRDSWFTPWGGPPDVRSMSTDPNGALYVNVHVGGVLRSADGGESWEPTIEIGSDVHQVFFDPSSGLLLAASSWGLGVSDDDGDTWEFHRSGLHATYARAVTVAGDKVLVSASTGPRTRQAAVYRKRVRDKGPFERCTEGLPEWIVNNVDTACLAASGSEVAFGTHDGSVFASDDQGNSWELVAEGLPPVRCVALTTS